MNRRMLLLGRQPRIRYLINENFTTADNNPLTSPRTCEPGPGTVAFRDVEGKLVIDANGLNFGAQATAVYAEEDAIFATPVITRTPGQFFVCKWKCSTDGPQYPMALVDSTTPAWNHTNVRAAFWRSGALTLSVVGNAAVGPAVTAFVADGTEYWLGILVRATGYKFFIKGGIYTYWTKLYETVLDTTATMYLAAAGNTAVFIVKPYRHPAGLWLDSPLLSTSGAMTMPTTNGLGHAEGVAGGLGAGGANLTMLDAGTYSTAGGYILNTPVAGVEAFLDSGLEGPYIAGLIATFSVGNGAPTSAESADAHAGSKAQLFTATAQYDTIQYSQTTLPCVLGNWYRASFWGKRTVGAAGGCQVYLSGDVVDQPLIGGRITEVAYTQHLITYRSLNNATNFKLRDYDAASFDTVIIDDVSYKPLPISQLITNQLLATTDVLAEMVISAYTLGSQCGIIQADRSFAAKAAATAAAGQAVISLKEVTGVGGVGLAITDSITIAGTTYTIASVTGGSNVAYNDTLKTQTVTLGGNLGAEVLADAKVGLDWAAWNGVIGPYFDGSGNVKLDEVVAGVYTNRLSAAVTFVADKRLIVRKIGSEYRVFYNEDLVGTTSLVAAAASVGKYCGIFSTYNLNTITSMVCYDTSAVTNLYSNLDKYSRS